MSENARQVNSVSIRLTENSMIDNMVLHTSTLGHNLSVEWQEVIRVPEKGWENVRYWRIKNEVQMSPRQAQLLIDALIYGLDKLEGMCEDKVERIDGEDLVTPRPTINDVKRNAEESAGENFDALKGLLY